MRYEPMLASMGAQDDLKRTDWLYEPKLDGTRAIMTLKDDHLTFVNRNGNELTQRFPEMVQMRKHIRAKSCVFDGEIVVYDADGRPDFNALAQRDSVDDPGLIEERAKQLPATYVVFDVLELEGESLIDKPLSERRDILADLIRNAHHIEQVFWTEHGTVLWKEAKRRKLEGVMAKAASSRYQPGQRSSEWRKIKLTSTIDAIIVGYTSEKRVVSSLVLSAYHNDELICLGRVGTGFTEAFLTDLAPKLKKLATKTPIVTYKSSLDIAWVKPQLVCEVKYLELTKDHALRAPSFLRLRTDKAPKDCVL